MGDRLVKAASIIHNRAHPEEAVFTLIGQIDAQNVWIQTHGAWTENSLYNTNPDKDAKKIKMKFDLVPPDDERFHALTAEFEKYIAKHKDFNMLFNGNKKGTVDVKMPQPKEGVGITISHALFKVFAMLSKDFLY